MKNKLKKYIKFFIICMFICNFSLLSYADNEDSIYVSKKEVNRALFTLNQRINTFDKMISAKITDQISTYLYRNSIWSNKVLCGETTIMDAWTPNSFLTQLKNQKYSGIATDFNGGNVKDLKIVTTSDGLLFFNIYAKRMFYGAVCQNSPNVKQNYSNTGGGDIDVNLYGISDEDYKKGTIVCDKKSLIMSIKIGSISTHGFIYTAGWDTGGWSYRWMFVNEGNYNEFTFVPKGQHLLVSVNTRFLFNTDFSSVTFGEACTTNVTKVLPTTGAVKINNITMY